MRGVSSKPRVLTYGFVRKVVEGYLRERIARERGSVFTVKTRHVRCFAKKNFKTDISPMYITPILINDFHEAVVGVGKLNGCIVVRYDKEKLVKII